MQFTSKQIVTMVIAVCVASVLTPVAVGAATGTLTNIIDPVTDSRQARVTSNGALQVAQHAAPPSGGANMSMSRLGLGYLPLASATYPVRIAVTDVTIIPTGSTTGVHQYGIEAWVRKTTTGTCSAPNTGEFNRVTLRRVSVRTNETLHLTFPGMPLLPHPGNSVYGWGCFGISALSGPSNATTYVYAGTYKFTP